MAGKIAEETNTSVQAVRRWAAGETEPSRDKLVAMANYLGVTLQWLIAGQQPKWNDPVPPSPETTKTQQDYLIVEAGDLQELQQLVRQHLDDGFEIEGGVFVFNVSHFGQTLKQRLEKM